MLLSTSVPVIVSVLLRLALAQSTLAPRQVYPLAASSACETAGDILIQCESSTTGFDSLPPAVQVSCACSSATLFDNSINACLGYLAERPDLAATYSTALPFSSLCAGTPPENPPQLSPAAQFQVQPLRLL